MFFCFLFGVSLASVFSIVFEKCVFIANIVKFVCWSFLGRDRFWVGLNKLNIFICFPVLKVWSSTSFSFFLFTFKIELAKSNYKNKFLMVFRVDELNLDYKEVWIGIYRTFQISVADFSVILSNLDIRFRCDANRENTLQNILHHNVARRCLCHRDIIQQIMFPHNNVPKKYAA